MIEYRHAQGQSLGNILRLPNGHRCEPILKKLFQIRTDLPMHRPCLIEAVEHKQIPPLLSLFQHVGKRFSPRDAGDGLDIGNQGDNYLAHPIECAWRGSFVESRKIQQRQGRFSLQLFEPGAVGASAARCRGQQPMSSGSLPAGRWDRQFANPQRSGAPG